MSAALQAVPVVEHSPSIDPLEIRPSYDASPEAYRRLRRKIVEAGLLNRRYGYYLGRTLVSFGMLAAGLAMAFLAPQTWTWFLATIVVMGVGLAQVAMIGHDCGHLQIFKRASNNWLLGQFCFSMIVGVGFWSWRDRHNTHHVETNDEDEDPDLSFGGFFTLNEADAASRTGLSRLIVRYQAWLFVPVVTSMLSITMRAEGWRFAFQDLHGARRLVELSILSLNGLLWLSPALVYGWWWLAVFAGVNAVGGLYLGMTIAPNHKGMPTWAHGTVLTFLERQVIGSRNILPGPIAEFVFGGLNYQIEHHLFPNMPRANLGACHDIVRPFCLAQGLPYEEVSVWESYRQMFAAFARCGRATR
ncbi:MAG: fatty acid desaturase [Chloroflexota bacterium]